MRVQAVAALLAALGTLVAAHERVDDGANPIRKVVTLMQDMSKEIEAEMNKEEELYEKFTCICQTSDAELVKVIEKAQQDIKELTSKLEEEGSEKKQLEEDLKTHYSDKASAEADLSKATNLREKEEAEAQEGIATSRAGIAGLAKAIPVLEKGTAALMQDGQLPKVLRQVVSSAAFLGTFDRRSVLAFLDGESGSGGSDQVLGIIKQMKDQFELNLEDALKTEQAASAGFEELKAAKREEIEVSAEAIETKEKRAGELGVSISQNSNANEDAENELSDAQEFLGTLRKQCAQGKLAWEGRLKMRKEEIAAISEAVKILTDDDALDIFKKAVPASAALTQTQASGHRSVTGFLQQVQAQTYQKASKLERAASIIAQISQIYKNSRFPLLLNAINSKVREAKRSGDKAPVDFSNVEGMIDGMITVLKREQADDDKKKQWCTSELSKAEKEERMKQEEMDSVVSTIEEMADEISSITDELATLTAEVHDLDKSVAEATEQRKKEHEEYADTIAMTKAAIQLIEKAKKRLAKVYGPKQAAAPEESPALLQKHHGLRKVLGRVAPPPDLPDLPELKPTKGGGVIGLMVRITHELEMDMQEATLQEKTAQTDYVQLMEESQKSRAQNLKSQTDKNASKAVMEEKITEAKEGKKMTYDELNNVHSYVGELHTSCDYTVENFSLRSEARQGEIQSLSNAKAVMSSAR